MASFPPNGSVFYQDSFGTLYYVNWDTIEHESGDLLDFTTTVKTPYIWGEPITGFIENKQLYRHGTCTTLRQVLAPNVDGYEIVSEGQSTHFCDVQYTFTCGDRPTDVFRHHVDQSIADSTEVAISSGTRFGDDSDGPTFGEPGMVTEMGIMDFVEEFKFVDVWNADVDVILASTSPSVSPSMSFSPSLSSSPSLSISLSPSPSPSFSPSLSHSPLVFSLSPSHSPSFSPSHSLSFSPSHSFSPSPSPSHSFSPSLSPSPSHSFSPSPSPSHSFSPSLSPSPSPSPEQMIVEFLMPFTAYVGA